MLNQKNFQEIFRLFGRPERRSFKPSKNKKAQFYLIAAIIIIGIIIILSSVTNYIVTKKKDVKLYDLGEEFKEEGARVVDYGIYSAATEPRDTIELMEDVSGYFATYSEQKEKGSELVFAFGNTTDLKYVTYTSQNTGDVKLVFPTGQNFNVPGAAVKTKNVGSAVPIAPFDTVNVTLIGQEYIFELHEGENFFFVISKNVTDTSEVYKTKKE